MSLTKFPTLALCMIYMKAEILSTEFYKNGLKHNRWKVLSQRIFERSEIFKNGKKRGKYEGFYVNGNKNFSFNFLNNEYHGTNSIWTKDGLLIEELITITGMKKGVKKPGIWMEK